MPFWLKYLFAQIKISRPPDLGSFAPEVILS